MSKLLKLIVFVSLCCLCAAGGHGVLLGGPSVLTEKDFLNESAIGFDFKGVIENSFINDNKGSNELRKSYHAYICGSKQVSFLLSASRCIVVSFVLVMI